MNNRNFTEGRSKHRENEVHFDTIPSSLLPPHTHWNRLHLFDKPDSTDTYLAAPISAILLRNEMPQIIIQNDCKPIRASLKWKHCSRYMCRTHVHTMHHVFIKPLPIMIYVVEFVRNGLSFTTKIFVRFGRIDRCILNVMPCLWKAHGMPRVRPQQNPHKGGGQIQWVCMHATIFRNKNKKHIAWMLATANNSQLENCFEALWMAFQFHLRIYATWNANRSATDTFACDRNEWSERKETFCA